jgi:hypothetical protein
VSKNRISAETCLPIRFLETAYISQYEIKSPDYNHSLHITYKWGHLSYGNLKWEVWSLRDRYHGFLRFGGRTVRRGMNVVSGWTEVCALSEPVSRRANKIFGLKRAEFLRTFYARLTLLSWRRKHLFLRNVDNSTQNTKVHSHCRENHKSYDNVACRAVTMQRPRGKPFAGSGSVNTFLRQRYACVFYSAHAKGP